MSKWQKWIVVLVTLALGVVPVSAEACAVCFGQPDSKLAQGMNMGVLALLGVVSGVLVGFAAFFVFLARRAAGVTSRSAGRPPGSSSVN
jgi:hypothetical protein